MADQFQNKYRTPSARAPWHGYDGGVYFVTICTAGRECYFGEITDLLICRDANNRDDNCRDAINRVSTEESSQLEGEAQMQLSEIGRIAMKIFQNVQLYYPYAEIPLFVVMPNHIHAIVMIKGDGICRDAINRVSTYGDEKTKTGGITGQYNPMISMQLGTIIRGLKARVTHYARQNNIPFGWQSRFYDRIVRDQNELNRIAEYIENNVENWNIDKLNNINNKSL